MTDEKKETMENATETEEKKKKFDPIDAAKALWHTAKPMVFGFVAGALVGAGAIGIAGLAATAKEEAESGATSVNIPGEGTIAFTPEEKSETEEAPF